MCGRADDPTQHDVDPERLRLYDVEYYVNLPGSPTRRARVWGHTPDEARINIRFHDREFVATTKTPRIVR